MTRLSSRLGIVLAAILAAGACRRDRAVAPATAPEPASEPRTRPIAPRPSNLPLPDRLAREAHSRPAGAVRVEDVVAALQAGGVAVSETHQVLASTIDAGYCAMATTRAGLGLAICELDSPAAAARAAETSRERFDALVPGRTLIVNGQTLLTVLPHEGAALAAEARAATERFAAIASKEPLKGAE